MAKTLKTSTERTDKRKKQAKREAKAMLKIEQAKKEVQKAEQKASKAQEKLEKSRIRLHNLELALEQERSSQAPSAPQQPEIPQAPQFQPLAIEESAQPNGATQEEPELLVTGTPTTDDIVVPSAAPTDPDSATSDDSSAATSEPQDVEVSDEPPFLTEAESDTTAEPTGEWGDTTKDANLFTDTDLTEGNLSPEDTVVYHLSDDVTESDATPASEDAHPITHDQEEHDAPSANDDSTSDDSANNTALATGEGK